MRPLAIGMWRHAEKKRASTEWHKSEEAGPKFLPRTSHGSLLPQQRQRRQQRQRGRRRQRQREARRLHGVHFCPPSPVLLRPIARVQTRASALQSRETVPAVLRSPRPAASSSCLVSAPANSQSTDPSPLRQIYRTDMSRSIVVVAHSSLTTFMTALSLNFL